MSTAPTLPPSVTDMRVNALGCAILLAALYWAARGDSDLTWTFTALMVLTCGPIALLDLVVHRVHRRPSTGLDWDRPRSPVAWGRVATRWLGLAACAGAVLFLLWITPEYQGSFYDPFYRFLWVVGPPAAALSLPYMAWIDGRMVDPHDAYWHAGRALLGRPGVDWHKVADLARNWAIKGFFIPLMFVYGTQNLQDLRHHLASGPASFMGWFDTLYALSFVVDIVYTTAGYLLTLRVLDTHVRTAQPHMSGWVVALLCYQPFFSLVGRQYIFYNNGLYWNQWLAPYPALRLVWGAAILVLVAAFAWSTVTFGCRFSNLTHRGVLTNGLYRITKHPAYITKCASYWLIFVPFAWNGSAYEIVRDCFWLSVICFVYWARARTEEIHLSEDPDYVRYALWMNEHGWLAPLGRWIPLLRYRPPA